MLLVWLEMCASHIDEQRYSVLVEYLTFGRGGDFQASRMFPAGVTANEKRQQAAMFVLRDRLLYYRRATDAVNESSLKRKKPNLNSYLP